MGFNSTVIVLNDALYEIENDPDFGKKLSAAIMHLSLGREVIGDRGVNVSAGNHCNAATAIESHHADGNAIIAVGGNCATLLGFSHGTHHKQDDKLRILKDLARELGYSLRKNPVRVTR